MLQSIDAFDRSLLHLLNGSGSVFIDQVAIMLTNGLTWIPLYVVLLVLVARNSVRRSQVFLLLAMVAVALLLSEGVADGIVKPLAMRPRPVSDPSMRGVVAVVNGYVPGGYSFFSAHAANTFTVATFLSLVLRNRQFTYVMIIWALVNCWTRLYLGAHYPSDILVGILWGIVSGSIAFAFYRHRFLKTTRRQFGKLSNYVGNGFGLVGTGMVTCVLILTIAVVCAVAFYQILYI